MNRLIERARAPLAARGILGEDFDRLFEGFFQPVRWVEEATSELVPAIDVVERANEFLVQTELPGVRKDDIDVTIENGVLTISGEIRNAHAEQKDERVVRQERRYGRFARSLRLGTQVDEKHVKANYKDGVLELLLPKAEEVKPKKISVGID
jgi:HSP20 family protein